jgi:uncharacterized protein (TIGR02246 family)
MKHRFHLLILAAFVVATRAIAFAAPTTERDIKEAVLATNAAMITAANQLDTQEFFSFIVEDGCCPVVQNGIIFRTRQEAKDAVDRGLRGIVKIERRIDHPEVTVLGPDAALLVGEGSVTATGQDGRVMTGTFAVSLVFVRRDSSWKIVHGHYSIPPRS